MNWEAIGAVGEIMGAIAVVVSLVYLASQIKHNTVQVEAQVKALHQDAINAASTDFTRFRLSIAQDPQVAALWRKGTEDFGSLTTDEKAQIEMLFSELFWAYENMLMRRGLDAVDDEMWKLVEQNIDVWAINAGIREWWPSERKFHSSELVSVVDRIVDQRNRDVD